MSPAYLRGTAKAPASDELRGHDTGGLAPMYDEDNATSAFEIDALHGGSTITHYASLVDLEKTWCGAERKPVPYQWLNQDASCVVCRDLIETFGRDGWRAGLGVPE
jgi:hypothetical protein